VDAPREQARLEEAGDAGEACRGAHGTRGGGGRQPPPTTPSVMRKRRATRP
jgi:hypothetical protein